MQNDKDQQVFRDCALKGLDDQSIQAVQTLSRSDRIDFQVSVNCDSPTSNTLTLLQLVAAVVGHIMDTASQRGGILIFLPGVQEIRQCIQVLREMLHSRDVDILPLHANLSNEEQRLVFTKSTSWKIIAATNVAEVLRFSSSEMIERTLIKNFRRLSQSMM